jgi:hypothetical protein
MVMHAVKVESSNHNPDFIRAATIQKLWVKPIVVQTK